MGTPAKPIPTISAPFESIAGAEKLLDATFQIYARKFGIRVLEGYGATECSPVVCINSLLEPRVGAVGKFLPGMEWRIEPMEGVPEGGRLFVRGPNVMKGYLNPDSNAKFQSLGGWYDTGDIVRVDKDGYAYILGRLKRFAKISGEMVSLTAIEDALAGAFPKFGLRCQLAVVAFPDEDKGERLVAVTNEPKLQLDDLRAVIKGKGFSNLCVPRELRAVREIPSWGRARSITANSSPNSKPRKPRRHDSTPSPNPVAHRPRGDVRGVGIGLPGGSGPPPQHPPPMKPLRPYTLLRAAAALFVLAAGLLLARQVFFHGPFRNPAPLPAEPIIDLHCHAAGIGAGNSGCFLSPRMRSNFRFRIYLDAFGVTEADLIEHGDLFLLQKALPRHRRQPTPRGRGLFALDGVVDDAGRLDTNRTEVYIPNDYMAVVTRQFTNLLFGASIHPRRPDAIARLDQAVEQGAVLVKWISLDHGYRSRRSTLHPVLPTPRPPRHSPPLPTPAPNAHSRVPPMPSPIPIACDFPWNRAWWSSPDTSRAEAKPRA